MKDGNSIINDPTVALLVTHDGRVLVTHDGRPLIASSTSKVRTQDTKEKKKASWLNPVQRSRG